jgi:DNA-binding MarR family transcriptional regulator
MAMRWRRAVESALREGAPARALGGVRLTFTQWLVLDALRELIADTDDAVNQREVAERVELDHGTISLVMATLEKKGLVDRGSDLTGRGWRIFVTTRGARLLRDTAAPIEAVSRL